MSKTPIKLSCIAGICALSLSVGVQALELKEGKWGFNSETTVPMAPEPMQEYIEHCITSDFDPVSELLQGAPQSCNVTKNADTAERLDVALACEIPGAGTMSGTLIFTVVGSSDQSVSGKANMAMNMNGIAMDMSSTMNGSYLGACTQ